MSDFEFADFSVEVENRSVLVAPPVKILWVTVAFAAVSVLFFFINGAIGYAISIVASVLGAFVVYRNQQLQSNPNYMSYSWFPKALVATRYSVTVIAVLHIIRLAIESAR